MGTLLCMSIDNLEQFPDSRMPLNGWNIFSAKFDKPQDPLKLLFDLAMDLHERLFFNLKLSNDAINCHGALGHNPKKKRQRELATIQEDSQESDSSYEPGELDDPFAGAFEPVEPNDPFAERVPHADAISKDLLKLTLRQINSCPEAVIAMAIQSPIHTPSTPIAGRLRVKYCSRSILAPDWSLSDATLLGSAATQSRMRLWALAITISCIRVRVVAKQLEDARLVSEQLEEARLVAEQLGEARLVAETAQNSKPKARSPKPKALKQPPMQL
ncbi:hypothetical protein BX070DRAFT_255459 [Coemansia spiralis]|nr:hypothetical protein BX070DRAFT_255459 [Coemansia spiralis]